MSLRRRYASPAMRESVREEPGSLQQGSSGSGKRSLRARASRGMLVILAQQAGAQLVRLAGNLVLARLLFPEAFGLMALVYLVIFALEQISNLGVSAAVLRLERGEEPAFLDTIWTLQVVRGLLLWLLAAALAPLMSRFYGQPELAAILPVASFNAVLLGLASPKLHVLTRRLDLTRRVTIEFAGQVVALVTMIAFAWRHPSVWVLVFGGLASQSTVTVLSHVWIPGPRNRFGWDPLTARQIYAFGKWVFASSGVSFLQSQMDLALLGRLVPAAVLGVYSLGSIIPNLLRDILFRLSSSVLAPAIAEASRESLEALSNRYATARRVMLPAGLLLALSAAIVAPAFFRYLYDERYVEASWITQLMLLRFWFAYLQVTGCLTLLASGDGRPWAVSSTVGVLAVSAGCLLGFQVAGLAGALVGVGLGNAAAFAVPALQLWRLGVASPFPELGYTALGGGLAALALGAGSLSGQLLPLADPSLHTLVVGFVVIAPFGLWTARRILRELRLS